MQHVMLHSALYVQREPFCVPSLNVCIVFGMLCATCTVCFWCSMMMTSSSFIAGEGPLPDDVASAFSTCVAAMTQLRRLVIHDLSLHVIKTLVERTQPLEDLTVGLPGVNWVSVSVFCQCAHNTVLLVAVFSVGWMVSSDYCPIHCRWYCSTSDVVM